MRRIVPLSNAMPTPFDKASTRRDSWAWLLLAAFLYGASAAAAQAPRENNIPEELNMEPFVALQISGDTLSANLSDFDAGTEAGSPSDGLTIGYTPGQPKEQTSRLDFVVAGNVKVAITAEPSEFLRLGGGRYLGMASHGPEAIGYDIVVQFPNSGRGGYARAASATLPGSAPGPTTPPLGVNLLAAGLQQAGTLFLVTNRDWSTTEGIPLPGSYVGQLTLTIAPDN